MIHVYRQSSERILTLTIKTHKMANMSYCRFENTYRDLLDCLNAMNDNLSESEAGYRERLVDVCKDIIEEYELVKMSEEDDEEAE